MRTGLEDFGQIPSPTVGLDTTLLIDRGLRYRERLPPTHSRACVSAIWRCQVGNADARLRLVPDGCVEISRSRDGDLTVFGPSTTWSDIVLPGAGHFVGCRLRAGAARALLGVPANELRNLVVDGRELPALRPLAGREAPWHVQIFRLGQLNGAAVHACVVRATTMLASGAAVRAAAHDVGLSTRELRRRFTSDVGMPPDTYRRITRARRALAAIAVRPRGTLASIAADNGFSDHSHLSREIAAVTGVSPRELTRAEADR